MPLMENENTSNDLKRGENEAKSKAGTIARLGKEAYKKANEIAAKEGLKEIFIKAAASFLGPESLLVVLALAILIMIPVLFLSAMPVGNLFQTEEVLQSTENNLYIAIENAYYAERNSAKVAIRKYVNENYACNARNSDITVNEGVFTIDTDTCLITASLSPSLSSMKQNISAYVNAVNGTIAYFGPETDSEIAAYENGTHAEIEKYEGEIFIKNADGSVSLTEDAKTFYEEHSDEITNTASEEYITSLNLYSTDFFVYDENTERWDFENFHMASKTHQEWDVVGTEEIEVNGIKEEVDVYGWVDVTVPAWYGNIGILIFYDLSGYKADELAECVKILDEKESQIDAYLDSSSVVNAVLNEYYASYIGSFNGYYDDDGSFNLGRDNRETLFQKLLDDGTLMYVPISGLSSNFMEGKAGYSGEILFAGYTDKTSREIWTHITSLRKSGVIGYRTAMWNCTAFAQAWFYDLYGVNALYGNGREMVNNLLSENNELVGDWGAKNFYRGSSPAPGGIFSIGSPAGGNHVGCVDAVDYENKTITFSDGNTNGAANSTSTISIRRTKTFDEFESYVKSCCAHHGGTAGCWITYANPIREEE